MATLLTTTAPTISATGISAPAYADVLAYLVSQYQGIFGADVYLGPDSQDYQFLAVIARSINDANSAAIAIYNAYSPQTASGANLSSAVKINGLRRNVATNSSVTLSVSGVAGTIIGKGVAQDAAGYRWDLPAQVVIPTSGALTVTAVCETLGAIQALAGTVNQIATPTLGWQAVTNSSAAATGSPVESDAALRQRQAISTALPSLTVLNGIVGAIASVAGVTRYAAYENDAAASDANGVPRNSIALVIEGGDTTAIANAIATKKTPGVATYGTTVVQVNDLYGLPRTIRFFRPANVTINVAVSIQALSGYSSVTGLAIQASMAAYLNGLGIGQKVMLTRLYLPANLANAADGSGATFEVLALTINGAAADYAVPFNGVAVAGAINVAVS